jgi:hypothetical protein
VAGKLVSRSHGAVSLACCSDVVQNLTVYRALKRIRGLCIDLQNVFVRVFVTRVLTITVSPNIGLPNCAVRQCCVGC